MSKKQHHQSVNSEVFPELETFVASKMSNTEQITPAQLRTFWKDLKFKLGASGTKLKIAIKNQYYNSAQAINWSRDKDSFLSDISELHIDSQHINHLKKGYLFATVMKAGQEIKNELNEKIDKLKSHPSAMEKVQLQLDEFKPRMETIISGLKTPVNSKPSSPREESASNSQASSPRTTTVVSAKASQSPSTSPRVTSFSNMSISSSRVASSKRFTMGSRKPVSTESSVEETSPVELTKIPTTSPATSPRRDMTLGSPKPTKKLPPLPKPEEVAVDTKPAESKRNTVTLSREGMRKVSLSQEELKFLPPIETSAQRETTDQNKWDMGIIRTESVDSTPALPVKVVVGRGRDEPVAKISTPVEVTVERDRIEPVAPQTVTAVVSVGRGRGRGRGRGVQPLATAVDSEVPKPSGRANVQWPVPKKATTSRGQQMPVSKRPAVPKFVPFRPGSQSTELPGLKLGLERPKPAARTKALGRQPLKDKTQIADSESVASTFLVPIPESGKDFASALPVFALRKDENERPKNFYSLPEIVLDEEDFVIPGADETVNMSALSSGSQPKHEEPVEAIDEARDVEDMDFSGDSKKETGLVGGDPVGEDTESDEKVQKSDEDETHGNSDGPSEKVVETPRAESESESAAEETPRTKAAKDLAQDKASIILKAIFRSSDLSRVIAKQQYKVKDYPAFNTLLKKFKGFDSTPLEESYFFSEENEGFRKVMVNLFDYLIVLQKEQLNWDKMPATYHVKKSAEDKIEGLVTLFNNLAKPTSTLEDAKDLLEDILASKEDKGLLQNRGTGAYVVGSFFRREKNPVNKQWIRSTVERNLVEIYKTITTALDAEKHESQADQEIEPSEAERAKVSV